MISFLLQAIGLLVVVGAGFLAAPAAGVAAVGVALVYVGLAVEAR
jgi:uncharacterized membrane protein